MSTPRGDASGVDGASSADGGPDADPGRRRTLWHLAAAALSLASLGVLVFETSLVSQVAANDALLVEIAAAYGFLLGTSGFVVAGAFRFAGVEPSGDVADTGRAVGKIENVLVLTLTLLGAYTALAIVFTAKSIVRWQDLSSENTTYYLTGSITNVTYSVAYGLAAAWVLHLPIG